MDIKRIRDVDFIIVVVILVWVMFLKMKFKSPLGYTAGY